MYVHMYNICTCRYKDFKFRFQISHCQIFPQESIKLTLYMYMYIHVYNYVSDHNFYTYMYICMYVCIYIRTYLPVV